PNRTVPVLVDSSGPALWESGAILRYLSNRYATAPFWPCDPSDRAQIDKWAEWSKISVATNFTVPIFWALVRTPAAKRNHDAIRQAVLKIANHQLSQNEYLAGNDFSLADISLGHILYRYFDIDITRADLPNLRAYYDRLAQRALYQTHVMISYEALRE
ncbi:MAG: glutathione binding-like protein, partial [Paracoccaceae bacterium]